jgi:E3 ubiquitin-protein ligase BRE1
VLALLPPSVLFLDKEGFKNHLAQHRQDIIRVVTSLHQRLPSPTTTELDTQNSLKSALAKNNSLLADIKRLTSEKDDRDDRLADTMMRLLSLEKKLDRSKSLTLAKIEAQAIHQKAARESEEPEAVENGDTPSRPSSRVRFPLQLTSNPFRLPIKMQWSSRQLIQVNEPLLLL